MTEAIRKALYASVAYFSAWGGQTRPDSRAEHSPESDAPRLGKYRVDYEMPSQEEIQASNPELDDLFSHSKVISVKREA